MRVKFFLLALVSALSGCASYTADYQERLVNSLPNQRDVTIHDSRKYPGNILCGSFSTLTPDGFSMRTGKFVVGEDFIISTPSKDDVLVYCSKDSASALYALSGITAVGGDWTPLAKIRNDILAIDEAITRYYNSANTLPRMLDTLLEGDYGVSAENLRDSWGHRYYYEGGLSGRTAPTYTLRSYGADGVAGGRDADADVSREQVSMLNHVLGIAGY